MMKIRIIGDDVLRQKASVITEFDDKLKRLIEEMFETMHASEGIGLAATQVGLTMRLLVMDTSGLEKGTEPKSFINPVIIETEGEATIEEGCLSIPGIREEVTRPEKIIVEFQDEDGKKHKKHYDGWMARVLQHEIDHLDGILFIDYLSPIKKKLIANQLLSTESA